MVDLGADVCVAFPIGEEWHNQPAQTTRLAAKPNRLTARH
jgi:hypothetical protein